MGELGHKEGWELKNPCLWIVLEKAIESPLDYNEIKLMNPKGNQPWILFGKTNAKAEAPMIWPPLAQSWFLGKDPDPGKNWRQKEKGVAGGKIGWIASPTQHDFEQTLGDSEGRRILEHCSPGSLKESDMI